jgi:K+-sensing histidine kinase KdpD
MAPSGIKGCHDPRELDTDVDFVRGDALRLQQVVSNLVATRSSSPRRWKSLVRVHRKRLQVRLEIQDEGRGISSRCCATHLRSVLAEDTSSRRSHSAWSRLSIVSHLNNAARGTISAASEGEGRGATFTWNFRLLRDARRGGGSKARIARARERVNRTFGAFGLIVDDDHDGRAWVRHELGGRARKRST